MDTKRKILIEGFEETELFDFAKDPEFQELIFGDRLNLIHKMAMFTNKKNRSKLKA